MKLFKIIGYTLLAAWMTFVPIVGNAHATENDYGFGVSPMKEYIVLNPGEIYHGSFNVTNPAMNSSSFRYVVRVLPFYVDDNYNAIFSTNGSFNQIADWINLEKTQGTLAPNSVDEIHFTITVPDNAPAGGQYAAIEVQSADNAATESASETTSIKLTQLISISHTIYAEIAGTSVHSGEITSLDMQSFLLSGNISGSATIKNTGNVHGVATYKLQVFPLFSNEEIYTNEEDPTTLTILPNRSRYNETTWSNTPPIGIFNVIYTVEFEGVTAQVKKMVIKCPIWLLFIIIFAIIAIIMYFFIRSKNRKNGKKRSQAAKAE